MPEQQTDPIIGQKFGNVVVQGILGRGGMGAVYLGYHPGLDMKVAVKLLPDLFVGRAELVERFLREARLSGRLQHPNIVRTLDVGTSNGVYYLVMEYVEGVDAQRLLEHEGKFSPMRAVNIIGFVARALGEAHGQAIIHRDIKPANILIARDGKVKVTDFGLARSLQATTALTLSNQVVGTPHYMAPEQIRSTEIDERVDIYALGITLWQFLTGRLPFDGPTPMAVLLAAVNDPLPLPEDHFNKLPKEMREAIVAMTAKDPKRRLPNINAVLSVLKKARDALRAHGLDSTAPLKEGGPQVADTAGGTSQIAAVRPAAAPAKPAAKPPTGKPLPAGAPRPAASAAKAPAPPAPKAPSKGAMPPIKPAPVANDQAAQILRTAQSAIVNKPAEIERFTRPLGQRPPDEKK
ncbi:MAG: serine/threonine protein kinase [Planctomycetes bacterium]|nr:serine/threonine protein kinase [Planctomycetota bacterium]